jgi:hypothetical protein
LFTALKTVQHQHRYYYGQTSSITQNAHQTRKNNSTAAIQSSKSEQRLTGNYKEVYNLPTECIKKVTGSHLLNLTA